MTKALALELVLQPCLLQMTHGIVGSGGGAGVDQLAREAMRIRKAVLGNHEALTAEAAVEPSLVAARGGRSAEAQQQIGRKLLTQTRRAEQPLEAVDAEHAGRALRYEAQLTRCFTQ